MNLAKTAVAVSIKTLMERYRVAIDAIYCVYLAGAFEYFINVENAMRIGLLPTIELEKVEKVGNAAIEGARQALISKTKREDAETAAKMIENVKLEEEESFISGIICKLF